MQSCLRVAQSLFLRPCGCARRIRDVPSRGKEGARLAARMRQIDDAVSHVGLGWLFVFLPLLFVALWPLAGYAMSNVDTLEITTNSAGGVHARARMIFPATIEVIQGLLTDYPHWPDLFEVCMRLAE